MNTYYVQGETSMVVAFAAVVHSQMGYPKFGRNAKTGEVKRPQPGQAVHDVEGVELQWAPVYASPVDEKIAYYACDDTNGPHAESVARDGRFATLVVVPSLAPELFPQVE